jgi:hypothetical protein
LLALYHYRRLAMGWICASRFGQPASVWAD